VAAANGILDGFSCLSRAYGVGTNAAGALVIVGAGVDTNSPPKRHVFLTTASSPIAPIALPPTVTISGRYPDGFACSFLSLANPSIMCYLEYMTSLAPASAWTAIASAPGTGGLTRLSDSNPSGLPCFYRIRVQ
jgi:hypothetical protein